MLQLLRYSLIAVVLALGVAHCVRAEGPGPVPVAAEKSATPITPKFRGRTFDEWLAEFRSELDPETRIVSLKALIVFGANGQAKEVIPEILKLIDGYRMELSAFASTEAADELGKMVKDGELSSELTAFGLIDVNDFELFRAAISGLSRIGPQAAEILSEYVLHEEGLTTSRLTALYCLKGLPSPELGKIIPDLAAGEPLMASLALEYWCAGSEMLTDDSYRTCLSRLLQLEDPTRLNVVLRSLADRRHLDKVKVILPLLDELSRRNTDRELQVVVGEVRTKLQEYQAELKRQSEPQSKIAPAAAREIE